MMLPVIQDILRTIQRLGTHNTMTLYMRKDMIDLTTHLLQDFVDEGLLQILSEKDFPSPKNEISPSSFPSDKSGRHPSILLSLQSLRGYEFYQLAFSQHALNFLPFLSSDANPNIPRSFQTLNDAYFSWLFGIVMMDPEHPMDNSHMKELLIQYIDDYLQNTSEGIKLQIKLDIIRKRQEFKNGYIVVIGQGSTEAKKLTPKLMEEIVKQVSFCKENNIGVVYLYDETIRSEDLEEILSIYRNAGIACEPIALKTKPDPNHPSRNDFRYAFALLKNSVGVIGPDTFLMHVAELLSRKDSDDTKGPKAVMNMHADSAHQNFNISPTTIQVESWLAHAASENDTSIVEYIGELLTTYIAPLLNPVISANHPLMRSLQGDFIKNLNIAFAQWREKLLITQ